MHGRADGPVIHAARFELARRLLEHPDATARVALLRFHDRAHEVAELLVLGHALARAREHEVGDLGLATEQRDVPVVLRRTGSALAREALALGELAALELRASETQQCVAPQRRAVLTEVGLGLRELVDRRVEPPSEPVDEADGVRRPCGLGGIVQPRAGSQRRLGGGARADVVARVRKQVRELALHARGDEVTPTTLRRTGERVLRAPCVVQRLRDLVAGRVHDRRAEVELGEDQRIARRGAIRDGAIALEVLTADEVIGEVDEVDGDPGFEQRILHER